MGYPMAARIKIGRWLPSGLAAPSNAPIVPTTRPLLLDVKIRNKRAKAFLEMDYGAIEARVISLLQRQAG